MQTGTSLDDTSSDRADRFDREWVSDPDAGARNLLENCSGVTSGQRLLIVGDEHGRGYYDPVVGETIGRVAGSVGARVQYLAAPEISGPREFPEAVATAMQASDHVIFVSQIGDQVRFCETPGEATKTMVYTLDEGLLGSPFATVHHGLMTEMAEMLRAKWSGGGEWHVSCPLGTDLRGYLAPRPPGGSDENRFSVRLFPSGILPPLGAGNMSGVVVSKWMMSTQNRRYEPSSLLVDNPVSIHIDNGRITGFHGPDAGIVRAHYDHVGRLFDIDPGFVHSWHTGHHPKAHYVGNHADDLIRWGLVAFNSPRYTHLHTCGDYPPGEISLDVIDATITLGGETLYEDGRLVFAERDDVRELSAGYPGNEHAFDAIRELGL